MNTNVTQETLDMVKKAQQSPDDDITKSISTGTGLVAYDLQAPAKNLYPVYTPLRNSMPRVSGNGGTATNWRVVSSIVGSSFNRSGWVAEGQRSARMSYVTANKAASYVTIGEEDSLTYEAESAAAGFENVRATMTMRLLQQMMLKEEMAILGGNTSVALGTPTAPTLSASGSGATLPAATYSVIVVGLTMEGYFNSSIAGGVATTKTVTGADGLTYTLNGGCSNQSGNTTQAVTLGQTLFASTPAVNGAIAYAWFIGTAGSEKLEYITTINSLAVSTPLAGTHQAVSAITGDYSRNTSTPAYDGLVTNAFLNGNAGNSYLKVLATGTAGTGTVLTASGSGSIVEIDAMLKGMYDAYMLSPDVLYVSSQEQKNMTAKVTASGNNPIMRINRDMNADVPGLSISAGAGVSAYYNPYLPDGGRMIPVKTHPNVPAGTIIGWCEKLPIYYQNNNVTNTAEIKVRRDYYQIDWPARTRQYESGVYAEEVLAIYTPFAIGMITNIANG